MWRLKRDLQSGTCSLELLLKRRLERIIAYVKCLEGVATGRRTHLVAWRGDDDSQYFRERTRVLPRNPPPRMNGVFQEA